MGVGGHVRNKLDSFLCGRPSPILLTAPVARPSPDDVVACLGGVVAGIPRAQLYELAALRVGQVRAGFHDVTQGLGLHGHQSAAENTRIITVL